MRPPISDGQEVLRAETEALKQFVNEAVLRGPLWALHRAARGELGGPILQQTVVLSFRSTLASGLGFRLVAVAGPAFLVGLLLEADSALLSSAIVWQAAFLAVLLALSLVASLLLFSVALRRTRSVVFRRIARWSYEDLLWWGALVVVIPAVGFAALSGLLVHQHAIGVKGVPSTDPRLPYRTFETFVWNLVDAIPLLKAPKTLHWKPELRFPTMAGGGLVLAYKVLVILPFAQLVASGLSRTFGEADTDKASRAEAP